MNQPPPHGWHQPHQGWQQPPGYGYPHQQPPKKSKAPLVIASVFSALVLAGVITGLVIHLNVNGDGGTAKRSDELPLLCENIPKSALAKARTTNPNGLGSSELDLSSGKRTICSWNQTKGVDGKGYRSTNVYVSADQKEADTDYDRVVAQNMANTQGVTRQKPLGGLGDEATVVVVETKSAFMELSVVVRKGDTIVEVDCSGWDAGVFSNKKPDVAEFEAAARTVAEEVVGRI